MIIYGNRRSLTTNEILDKYGIMQNLQSQTIYLPKDIYSQNRIITIDDETTKIKDDSLSFRKDGNKYIVGINITDVGSFVSPHTIIDKQAINNYKCIYLPNSSIRLFNTDM